MAAYISLNLPLEIILMIADYLQPLDLLSLVQGIPHITTLLNSQHIQAQDENKHTILQMIVDQGLEYLIEPLAKWIPQSSISDNEGGSLLHQAVSNGDQRMAKALIHAGSDISAQDHNGRTALHIACDKGVVNGVQIVQLLLDHGANPSAADCSGRTPLHEGFGHNTTILQMLIKAGADLDPRRIPRGLTPLYYVAMLGRESAGRVLLEAGADHSIKTKQGETILERAALKGHANIVRLLLEFGVDITVRNEHGYTAVLVAALAGKDECIKVLHKAGADGGRNPRLSQVRGDQLIELVNEDVRELRRQVETKQLDRDKAARLWLIGPIDGSEGAGADLMKHPKRPEGVGWRRTGNVRIQCGTPPRKATALLH